MSKQYVEITFKTTGKVEIEAFGFKGGQCEKATKAFEEALGVVADRKKKPEFFQKAEVSEVNRIGG